MIWSRLKTLRARFALWTAGLLFMLLALFGAYIYSSVANGLYKELDTALSLNGAKVVDGLDIEGSSHYALAPNFLRQPENAGWLEPGFSIRVLAPDRQIRQEFGPYHIVLVPAIAAASTDTFNSEMDPVSGVLLRIRTVWVSENDRLLAIVQVAQPLDEVQNTLRRLLLTLLVAVPLIALSAGLGGYILAVRALAPIDRITRTAQQISAQDLSARLRLPKTDDETGRLANTLDDMLARLEAFFQRERQFTTNAAHELRTPLTAMRVILSSIRTKRRTLKEYEVALADLSQETDRLHTLTENLLQLARNDVPIAAPFEPVDLSTLLQDVADSLMPLAEAKHLSLVCNVPQNLCLSGNSDELIRLFANLLDNAIKYTVQGRVNIFADRSHDNHLQVTIADTGCGIPNEHLAHIFDRFYRVDRVSTAHGVGLGLAIALNIAHAHGGDIQVMSKLGAGSQFTVVLP